MIIIIIIVILHEKNINSARYRKSCEEEPGEFLSQKEQLVFNSLKNLAESKSQVCNFRLILCKIVLFFVFFFYSACKLTTKIIFWKIIYVCICVKKIYTGDTSDNRMRNTETYRRVLR